MELSSFAIVSTALALIISWALFALLCSYLLEAYAQIKAERGRFMRNYLFKQLQDIPNDINWAALVYLNGSVSLLSRDFRKPTNDIAPRVFSQALIEGVGKSSQLQAMIQAIEGGRDTEEEMGINKGRRVNTYNNTHLYQFKAATQLMKQSNVVNFFTQALTTAEMDVSLQDGKLAEERVYEVLVLNIESW